MICVFSNTASLNRRKKAYNRVLREVREKEFSCGKMSYLCFRAFWFRIRMFACRHVLIFVMLERNRSAKFAHVPSCHPWTPLENKSLKLQGAWNLFQSRLMSGKNDKVLLQSKIRYTITLKKNYKGFGPIMLKHAITFCTLIWRFYKSRVQPKKVFASFWPTIATFRSFLIQHKKVSSVPVPPLEDFINSCPTKKRFQHFIGYWCSMVTIQQFFTLH